MVGTMIAVAIVLSSLAFASPSNIQSHGDGKDGWKSKIKNVVILVEENRSLIPLPVASPTIVRLMD